MSDLNGNNTEMTELYDWFTYDPNDRKPFSIDAMVEGGLILFKASDRNAPKSFRDDGRFAVKPDDNIVGVGFNAFIEYLKQSAQHYGLEFYALTTDGVAFSRVSQ